nr:MAG TPA: cysteine-rich protein [Caudoviricetes sp.]DAZ32557.1 MAG TPA: cysteine-rich protein [Caudoviricetes sp.]
MMNSIIKTKEFECPCCGEKLYIQINESGDIIITPFILPKEDCSSIGIYDFGMKGGENSE